MISSSFPAQKLKLLNPGVEATQRQELLTKVGLGGKTTRSQFYRCGTESRKCGLGKCL